MGGEIGGKVVLKPGSPGSPSLFPQPFSSPSPGAPPPPCCLQPFSPSPGGGSCCCLLQGSMRPLSPPLSPRPSALTPGGSPCCCMLQALLGEPPQPPVKGVMAGSSEVPSGGDASSQGDDDIDAYLCTLAEAVAAGARPGRGGCHAAEERRELLQDLGCCGPTRPKMGGSSSSSSTRPPSSGDAGTVGSRSKQESSAAAAAAAAAARVDKGSGIAACSSLPSRAFMVLSPVEGSSCV